MVIEIFSPDLPHAGPRIHGVQSKYTVGDRLTADCMLPVSRLIDIYLSDYISKTYLQPIYCSPAAVLTWYINSDTADPGAVSRQYTVTRSV